MECMERMEEKNKEKEFSLEPKEQGNKARILTFKPHYIMHYITNNHVLLFYIK